MPLRMPALAALALIAFAANSLLCRAALAHTAIDAATFTTVRLLSGAIVLGMVAWRRASRTPGAADAPRARMAVGRRYLKSAAHRGSIPSVAPQQGTR